MNIREQGNSGIDTQSERLNRINQINQAFVKYFFEHFVKHKWPYSLRHTCEKEPGSATEPIGYGKAGQRWCGTAPDAFLCFGLSDWVVPRAHREWMEVLSPSDTSVTCTRAPVVHPRRRNKDQSPAAKFLHNLCRVRRKWERMSQHGVTHLAANRNAVMGFCQSCQVSYKLQELHKWHMKCLFNLKLVQLSIYIQ